MFLFLPGIDLFIGEEAYHRKGLESKIISDFLKTVVFIQEGIDRCIIDPEVENVRAIKAYEKVGFKHVKTFKKPNESFFTCLMKITKDEVK